MLSTKPYVIRALYEWICDSNCTPYIVIFADYPGVEVPRQYVTQGQIVLNISIDSVKDLDFVYESVSFFARFSGKEQYVYAPIDSISSLYARETGEGISFEIDGSQPDNVGSGNMMYNSYTQSLKSDEVSDLNKSKDEENVFDFNSKKQIVKKSVKPKSIKNNNIKKTKASHLQIVK